MIKKVIIFVITLSILSLGVWISFQKNMGDLYTEYKTLAEYRRLSPDFLPNTDLIRLTAAGHDATYADYLWIGLIQFIGDNIGNGKYATFVNPLVEKITELHPYFPAPYNLGVLLTPGLNTESPNYELTKNIVTHAYQIGEKGIKAICNQEKIEKIGEKSFNNELWDDISLKNPCKDDMLAYNLAYIAQEIGNKDAAVKYYKIASMNDGAPEASRFLGPLVIASEGDHKSVGELFLLIALEGYDEDPFLCRQSAAELLGKMRSNRIENLIEELMRRESSLSPLKDSKNPLAQSATACYPSLVRAIKQFYLGYITEKSAPFPEITTSDELLEKGLVKFIPTISEQSGWGMEKKDGIWRYKHP